MLKRSHFLSLILTIFLFTGCAFTGHKIELEYHPISRIEKVNLGNLYFSKLTDERADKNRVGIVKNGFGMETANVQTDQDVTIWISKAIVSELANIGYTVSTVDINKTDITSNDSYNDTPILSGSIIKVFAEPIVGFWAGDVTGDIQITLEVHKNNKIQKKFYNASEKVTTMVWTAGFYKESLEKTLQSLLVQIRNDFMYKQ